MLDERELIPATLSQTRLRNRRLDSAFIRNPCKALQALQALQSPASCGRVVVADTHYNHRAYGGTSAVPWRSPGTHAKRAWVHGYGCMSERFRRRGYKGVRDGLGKVQERG